MSSDSKIPGTGFRRAAWLALLAVVLVGFAIVAIPLWVIQPFKAQSPLGLEVSYALRRWSPLITSIELAAGTLLTGWLWRGTDRWWRKVVLVLILLPVAASFWFARQNHFEWMFHPLPGAAYVETSQANFVGDSDIVLAVEHDGEAVAYPVRLMAYHHLVQDVVGGTPLVATY
jgi:hypothetical protein